MKRFINLLAFGVGLLLLAIAALAFARGFWACDETRISWLRSDGGGIFVQDAIELMTAPPICTFTFQRQRDQLTQRVERNIGLSSAHHAKEPIPFGTLAISSPHPWERLGFFFEVNDDMSRSAFGSGGIGRWRVLVGLPTWCIGVIGVLIAAPPAFSFRRVRRQRVRRSKGLCPSCGYDLRGANHDRCPECGHFVSPASHDEPSSLSKMK